MDSKTNPPTSGVNLEPGSSAPKLDMTYNQSNVDQSTPSTETPSIIPSFKEKKGSVETGSPDVQESLVVSTEEREDEEDYPTGFRFFVIIAALLVSMFLVALDSTIVATAIPKITDEFQGLGDISWYGSAFFMTVGGFQSAWGKGYKYFPLKLAFLLALFIFEVGSLICGVAPNSTALIVGRAIAGMGGAGLTTGAYTILGFAVEPKMRPMYTGIMGAAYGIAAVLGPLLGGIFSDQVTWRWCFYINLPLGGVAGAVFFVFFHTPSTQKIPELPLIEKLLQMDPLGIVLIMGGLVAFFLAMQYGGQTHPWNSSVVIGLIIGSVLIFIAFVAWEIFQDERAMIPPRILRRRTYLVASSYWFFFASTYYLVLYYLPIYFQSVFNASPIGSGVRNLPLIITITLSTVFSGGVISATGLGPHLQLGFTCVTIIGCSMLYTLEVDSSKGKWIGYQILSGIGFGGAFQVPIIIAQAYSSLEDMAEATATCFCLETIGTAVFLSAAQAAFVNVMVKKLLHSAPGVIPMLVVASGASELRSKFSPEQIPGILEAYMAGLKIVFALVITAAGVAILISLGNKWQRLDMNKVKNGVGKEQEKSEVKV